MGGIGDFNVEGWRKKRDGRRIAPEVRKVYSKGGIQDVKPSGATGGTAEDGKIV